MILEVKEEEEVLLALAPKEDYLAPDPQKW